MKRIWCILLISAALFLMTASANAEDNITSARAFVLYCPQNGEVILSKNEDECLPMASTTKIMTTLLALEEAMRDNRTVQFSEEMIAEGSSMYLEVGEEVTLDDLCVGMMMQSGNDAANAAALAIDESFERFSDRMNIRASEIGMKNSHFVTPSGLDDEEHYSTAYDMALLMAQAMKNERFREITGNTSMTVDFISPDDKRVTYQNHNKLLRLDDRVTSGKTGYTDEAGRCLVSSAEQDGVELICVTLNDPNDWDDHIMLYDRGFELLSAITVPSEGEIFSASLAGTKDTPVLLTAEPQTLILRKELEEAEERLFLPDFVYAPVRKGEQIGELICKLKESEVRIPLYAQEDVSYIESAAP